MMHSTSGLWTCCLLSIAVISRVAGQQRPENSTNLSAGTAFTTISAAGSLTELPSGPLVSYISYNLTRTPPSQTSLADGSVTQILRNDTTSSPSHLSTPTTTTALPRNTQACNNHVELCDRKYSNITHVAAHNFAFARVDNLASNQQYGTDGQLNDGIRMLQGQTRYVNGTVFYCHSSCDLLNAGTAEAVFREVRQWVERHPFDVVTLLIGNGDFIDVNNFTAPIQQSGLTRYLYTPSQIPMTLNSWPTLAEMILRQQRVVIFMDYQADQSRVPYILDEFSQLWETPFSPTNTSFPCTVQRPPNLPEEQARDRLYMANHNLNIAASVFGNDILLPNRAALNQTNAVSGFSSLGVASDACKEYWSRSPNFLLVDYYNYGNFPGSVFQVAAEANGLVYDRNCCGSKSAAMSVRGLDRATFKLGLLSLVLHNLLS